VLSFRRVPADSAQAQRLITAMIDELAPLYGRIDVPGAPSASPDDFRPPAGAFLLGEGDGAAVCAGGVKRLSQSCAEIKRMYVVPSARGQGVARALLGALERTAGELGYEIVRLDTGPRQPHALALYLACGYVPIADYNGNPFASFWGEKHLAPNAIRPRSRGRAHASGQP
jgi:GNAT superfamily N-acetyltransferase